MIPANIDFVGVIQDLNRWGLGDRKIEAICGFADGHITHLKAGRRVDMMYRRAARLYNFWLEENSLRGKSVSWSADTSQHLVLST